MGEDKQKDQENDIGTLDNQLDKLKEEYSNMQKKARDFQDDGLEKASKLAYAQ
jgi:hypothetical protein